MYAQPKFGRLLLLAAPEAGWIAAGLLALTLRLPFNLAMPHFISTALAATLEVCLPPQIAAAWRGGGVRIVVDLAHRYTCTVLGNST
jgi:hypothetical protein